MTSSDTGALMVAALANVAGLVVALAMWRRQRRRRRVLGSRHPSARPPLRVDLVDADGGRRIRLAVPVGAPDLAIDIVSFRRQDPPGAWESEPLAGPLVVASGTDVVLGSSLGADASAADVVVAWTARGDEGEVPGSQLFRVPAERDASATARVAAGLSGRAALVLVALVVGAGTLVGLSAWDDVEGGPASTTTSATSANDDASARPAGTGASTATTAPTDVAGSTLPPTANGSTAGTTTDSTTTTVTEVPDEPVVLVGGRIAPCRFGDDCLVVDFTIAGFDELPTEYVCEFGDGSRFTFRFGSTAVTDASATRSADATIIVEVGNIRSDPVSRDDVPPS